MFSMSCVATVLTVLYAFFGVSNLYRLMNPLSGVDLSVYPPHQLVNPLWDTENGDYQLKVYLSKHETFSLDFLESDEYTIDDDNSGNENEGESYRKRDTKSISTVLLWNDPAVGRSKSGIDRSSLSKTFVITTPLQHQSQQCESSHKSATKDSRTNSSQCQKNEINTKLGIQAASTWFDPSTSSSFASTSIIITAYNYIQNTLGLLVPQMITDKNKDEVVNNDDSKNTKETPEIITLDENGPIWETLMKDNTIHAHVLLIRKPKNKKLLALSAGLPSRIEEFKRLARSNSVILGTVQLVKHDDPIPQKPKRILYRDLSFILNKYIFQRSLAIVPPWNLELSQPDEYREWQNAKADKLNLVKHPYWKPEVAIRLVSEDAKYPIDIISASGMQIVQVTNSASSTNLIKHHPSGYAYLPPLHVDEMGLTSEKYIPLNKTVAAVPLRITLDTHGMGGAALTPQRWRLLTQMTSSLQSQKDSGLFEESDIDDVKSLIADTNVTLLAITMLASLLHLLFEFLTFKSDVEFWKHNTDLTGLSVRSLFVDVIFQSIILTYLVEMDSSLLVTLPQAISILIAMWKCNRAAGLAIVRKQHLNNGSNRSWFNRIFSLTGFEIQATRLNRVQESRDKKESKKDPMNKKVDLAALTDEMDRVAMRKLGSIIIPLVVLYTFYTLIVDEYSGWYSWLIISSSSAVYALGFVVMTPQLFLNYKLKSVAHLPWKVLCYRFLNTFIDDLFAFIIRMPTMARISCFRDDVVFIVYLVQRYIYPVDTSRPVEGGVVEGSEEQKNKTD